MNILTVLLDNLPSKYVDLIVNNVKNSQDLLDESVDIVVDMLSIFDFESSKEGYQFWEDVLDSITSGSKLPKIPIDISYPMSHKILNINGLFIMNVGNSGLHISIPLDMSKLDEFEIEQREFCLMTLN
jgi:hypothetical protein